MSHRWFHSLFGKLAIAQLAVLLVGAICLPLILSFLLRLTLDDFVTERLHKDAVELAASPRSGSSRAKGMFYNAHEGSRAFAIVDAARAVLARGPRPLPIATNAVQLSVRETALHQGPIDVVIYPTTHAGAPAWVIVTQDRRHPEVLVDDVIASFLSRFIWVVPAVLMLLLFANLAIVRTVTRSVAQAAAEADQIGPESLELRIDPLHLPVEVRPLVQAANAALARVEDGYRRQSNFIADVAHELRTPLALIGLRADEVSDPAVRDKLREGIARATHVVSQLMELAKAENAAPVLESVDPNALAQEAVIAHAPLVFGSGRSIALSTDEDAVKIQASPPLVAIMLTNLIDNAVRHSPVGTSIVVSVSRDGTIAVTDDGPGISHGLQGLAKQRYWRGDARRTDGAGLGLAIISRIMASHRGRLDIGRGSQGGARMRLQFAQADVRRT